MASSSENPPDKKFTPTRAGGIVRRRVRTVYHATWLGSARGAWKPGVTMLGFNKHPSHKILLSWRALVHAACTLSVTAAHVSISWGPSANTSGSTMGTSPLAWEMLACLANTHAFSWIASSVGLPLAGSIVYVFLHLENLAPWA